MSRPDITVTLNRSRNSRSQTGTARSSNNSASTSISDEDSGDGVQVSPSEGQDYSGEEDYSGSEDYSWIEERKHDLGPPESISRSSTSDHHQLAQGPLRHHRSRRDHSRVRLAHAPRLHRPHHPSSPESVGSHEELYPAYGPDLSRPRARSSYIWAPQAGGQSHQYAPSYASQAYSTYNPPNGVPQGQQLVPFNGSSSQYPYGAYQQMPPQNQSGYFPVGQHGVHPSVGMQMGSHGGTPYGGPEMVHPSGMPGYFPYHPQGYPVTHPMAPSPVHYQHYPSPPAHTTPPPPPAPAPAAAPAQQAEPPPPPEPPKPNPEFEELKQMLIKQKQEQEEKEAAAKKKAEEAAARAEAEKKKAEEIAAAAAEAAKKATTEAEKKAAEKAAEEAAKAAEETAKIKAEADAAIAAATAPPPPEEKKKPIRFKDAVGRKFSFPFHLCATWGGMEDLIKQAFLHVDIIGPHVAEGHYDLIGPNNEIILPAVWETVIEPDWTITMHMWPMPEPKPEEEPPPVEVPPPPEPPVEEKGKGPKGKKKPAKPSGLFSFGASSRPKQKSAKPAKKPAPSS